MTWMPWIGHLSSKALAACDHVGESLADFLGITTPKYSYEIAEADRMKSVLDVLINITSDVSETRKNRLLAVGFLPLLSKLIVHFDDEITYKAVAVLAPMS